MKPSIERPVWNTSHYRKSLRSRSYGSQQPRLQPPATFEQMMRAGFAQRVQVQRAKCLVARDHALLWVLFETGITVTELCALRVANVDQQTGMLRVRGRGGKERHLSVERV